jgi:hypothetical protein
VATPGPADPVPAMPHDPSDATPAAAGRLTLGDLTINRLGFGPMRITGRGIWGPPADHDTAIAVLRRAVELGVDFIDTADAYGPHVSEELIAEVLAPYGDVVVATKGGLLRDGPGQWRPDGRPGHLRTALDGSLKRLGLDQVPLYQLHRPDPAVPFEDSVGAIAELRAQGKVRHVGLSDVNRDELRRAIEIVPACASPTTTWPRSAERGGRRGTREDAPGAQAGMPEGGATAPEPVPVRAVASGLTWSRSLRSSAASWSCSPGVSASPNRSSMSSRWGRTAARMRSRPGGVRAA